MKLGTWIISATLVVMGGCSSPIGGKPTTGSTSARPETTRATMPTHSAPPVPRPVALDPFLLEPCALLPEEALRDFDLGPEVRRSENRGQESTGCFATGLPGAGTIDLSLFKASPVGSPLVMAYQYEASSPEFRPLEIRGMPAVVYGEGETGSRCAVAVGTDHNQGFLVLYEPGTTPIGGFARTCDLAVSVAGAVLDAL